MGSKKPSGSILDPSWEDFGSLLGRFGRVLGDFGKEFVNLWTNWNIFWTCLKDFGSAGAESLNGPPR